MLKFDSIPPVQFSIYTRIEAIPRLIHVTSEELIKVTSFDKFNRMQVYAKRLLTEG